MTANPASALPPASAPPARLSPARLQTLLTDGAEIALLDVRETGVYAHCHLLLAVSAPAWRLGPVLDLSLIPIPEPKRLRRRSYAVFGFKKKNKK